MNQTNMSNKPGVVLVVSAIIVSLFVIWGALSPRSLDAAAGQGLVWMLENFGWFYMLSTAFFVLFVIVLAISPFGKIRLGKPDERPDYSWYSWIGMLFAAGIGVGFVFWVWLNRCCITLTHQWDLVQKLLKPLLRGYVMPFFIGPYIHGLFLQSSV